MLKLNCFIGHDQTFLFCKCWCLLVGKCWCLLVEATSGEPHLMYRRVFESNL
jgi:hypothetical protein